MRRFLVSDDSPLSTHASRPSGPALALRKRPRSCQASSVSGATAGDWEPRPALDRAALCPPPRRSHLSPLSRTPARDPRPRGPSRAAPMDLPPKSSSSKPSLRSSCHGSPAPTPPPPEGPSCAPPRRRPQGGLVTTRVGWCAGTNSATSPRVKEAMCARPARSKASRARARAPSCLSLSSMCMSEATIADSASASTAFHSAGS
mmetsp:Transcript_4201/g.11866  ORF Transcript_4201/g.11866 Transcript_4201/m.11866 type:complete len:203 (-) Transcript_4201:518-1126(-)